MQAKTIYAGPQLLSNPYIYRSSVIQLENYLKLLAQPGRPVPPLSPLVVRDQLRVHVVAQLLAGWSVVSIVLRPVGKLVTT